MAMLAVVVVFGDVDVDVDDGDLSIGTPVSGSCATTRSDRRGSPCDVATSSTVAAATALALLISWSVGNMLRRRTKPDWLNEVVSKVNANTSSLISPASRTRR